MECGACGLKCSNKYNLGVHIGRAHGGQQVECKKVEVENPGRPGIDIIVSVHLSTIWHEFVSFPACSTPKSKMNWTVVISSRLQDDYVTTESSSEQSVCFENDDDFEIQK